jgi:hypothetical protein
MLTFSSVQEQEERDYHPQSSARNALAEAGMLLSETNAKAKATLEAAMRLGLYAVSYEATAYCHSTDAICGSHLCVNIYPTQARAKAAYRDMNLTDCEDIYRIQLHPKTVS